MLNITYPLALWLGLSLIPILLFYFLRKRFRRQPVSSVYLWSRLQNVMSGGSHLRWRTILLLLLQIIIAIAVVFAVAKPVWISRQLSKPGVVFLLDVSASMGAQDVTQTTEFRSRLIQARSIIAQQIEEQPDLTPVMVFLCSSGIQPLGSPTGDHRKLINSLMTVDVSDAGFNEAEVVNQLQAWLLTHKRVWQGVLVTDGGLSLSGTKLGNLFDGNLKTVIVGANGNNLGVTALRLLPEEKAQFIIRNGWPDEQLAKVVLEHNERIIARATLRVPTGLSNQTLSFHGPVRPGVYQIRLDQAADNFAGDDQYFLAVNQPRPVKILLVGNGNSFLRAVLNNPGVSLSMMPSFPAADFTGEGWDLIIADQVMIPNRLSSNILAFGCVPEEPAVRFGKPINGQLMKVDSTHPLLRFVDLNHVQISGGYALHVQPGVQILAKVNNQPVIAAWEKDGWHNVVFGTDLIHSDLGLSGAFPVFMGNLLQQCVPQWNNPLIYTLTVGETVVLAEPPTWQVINPKEININRRGPSLFIKPLNAGVFSWGQGMLRGVLTANIPPSELDIAPRPLHLSKNSMPPAAEYSFARISFEHTGLYLLLFCLCLEWVLWRGLPVGKR